MSLLNLLFRTDRTDIAKSGTSAILLNNDVPSDKLLSLREATNEQSVIGGQGYKKCNCEAAKNQCKTCTRFKTGILCNSRFHLSSPCCNK